VYVYKKPKCYFSKKRIAQEQKIGLKKLHSKHLCSTRISIDHFLRSAVHLGSFSE